MRTFLLTAAPFLLLLSACSSAQAAAPSSPTAPIVLPSETAPTVDSAEGQSALPTPENYRLRAGELIIAASPDDIPAIFANDSLFVDVASGNEEWVDEEGVIGVLINGEARAYPIRLLSLHEIVNDTVGGQPIAVTWCPLCYSALVFNRVVDGQELTFGVSGYLFHNNLVMYDHQSNTLWSQVLAQGIKGAYNREQLEVLGAFQSTWGAWKAEHPDTLVLSARQMGKQADEVIDPYVGYYTSGAPGLGGQAELDERLPAQTLVVGIKIGREERAYSFEDIRQLGVINDELGGIPILLVYNAKLNSVAGYARLLDGQALSFELSQNGKALKDAESASLWDIELGQATEGPFAGERLSRLTAPIVFWFAWSDIYPDTELYENSLLGEEK